MSITDRLSWLVYVLLCLLLILFVGAMVRAAVFGVWPFASRVDPQTGTAALSIETDAGTGCQYVLMPWGGIMPRMGPDGRQICAKSR